MLTTQAKTAAERKREQRLRQKLNQLKDVTYTLEQATIDIVTSHSQQQGITQSDYVNNALKEVVTSHTDNTEVEKLKAELATITLERNRLQSRLASVEHQLQDKRSGLEYELEREKKEAARLLKENTKLKLQLEKLTKKQ